MTRRMYIVGGIVVITVITAIILIVLNVLQSNEPTEEAINFCETYPETLFCEDETAEPMAIATDLFGIIQSAYADGFTEDFCDAFFFGNVASYCTDNGLVLFPDDFILIDDTIQIREIEPNIFDIRTVYTNDTLAYTFRLALNDSFGFYNISGLSYIPWEDPTDLELTDEEINTFMIEMIEESEDPGTFFCDTYFAYEANAACRGNEETLIENPTFIYNYTIVPGGLNTYTYTVSDEADTFSVTYDITLEEFESTLYLTAFDTIE